MLVTTHVHGKMLQMYIKMLIPKNASALLLFVAKFLVLKQYKIVFNWAIKEP